MSGRKNKIVKVTKVFLVFSIVFSVVFVTAKFSIVLIDTVIRKSFAPERMEFKVESVYSNKIRDNIVSFLDFNRQYLDLLNLNANSLCAQLKENFEIIKEVEWDFASSRIATIKVRGAQPLFKINKKFILADNTRLFDFDSFNEFDVDSLKDIYISEEFIGQKITDKVFSFLKKVSPFAWDKYHLCYLKSSCVVLDSNKPFDSASKQGGEDMFVANEQTLFDSKKIEQVEKIKEFFKKEIFLKTGRKRGYLFDIRFKNRVYARPIFGDKLELAKKVGRG